MYQDVKAHLAAISVLLKDIEAADSQTEALRSYAAVMAVCKDLRRATQGYKATNNIRGVITEIEGHMAAMVGLMPTWSLPMSQHLGHAHNAVHKLTLPTCFGQP